MTAPQLAAFELERPKTFQGHLMERWNLSDGRCCSPPAAPLVVDTHMHVWDEDPRPNRGLLQLGLLEDVLTEAWGEGVDLGVLVQPGFRGVNNSYIERSLGKFPGTLAGELEALKDYSEDELSRFHALGVRGLRFKATSVQKYEDLVSPRLRSSEFSRIARFMKDHDWHWGVQLAKEVVSKWSELLRALQDTGVPVIVDMFGRPDPLLPSGSFKGTQAILEAAARPAPAGRIWMELGAPFRVDPRCTYAEPAAADPAKCLPGDRVLVPRRGGNATSGRLLCCPGQTHTLLVELTRLFIKNIGADHVVWGTDWPFITDRGVTMNGLLDVMALWVPDASQRQRVLGANAVRPNAVGSSPLFPFLPRVTAAEHRAAGRAQREVLDVALRQPIPVQDVFEDQKNASAGGEMAEAFPEPPENGGLVPRWKKQDGRCCSSPVAPLVVDTHAHVWDEDPRPNRGFNQLGLLEDVLTEGWGAGVHLAVLVQPGFRAANNSYITRSLQQMPGRLAGEVEAIIDYDDETLLRYHNLGVRGLRFKATSLLKYKLLVTPRLESPELARIASFMLAHDWHWGVQLSKQAGEKWPEILRVLQETRVPVVVDMFGRPDPAAAIDVGTQAIVEAARRPAPAGKVWVELGGPFRVDPRCTYAEPQAALAGRCLPGDRVNVTRQGTGKARELCCPPRTHELFRSLAKLFATVVGRDYLLWGTDWPFISDTGVTTKGLLDAAVAWLDGEEELVYKVLGSNAIRPKAVGDSPLFPLLDLRKRPPMRVAGVFSPRRPEDALAFQLAVEEANAQLRLPVVLESNLLWQNDTDTSLQYFQTACRAAADGVLAVVGPPSSAQTAAMQNVFSPLALPVLATSASDPTLRRFENFLRLVPDDEQQSRAIVALVRHFNWSRLATVYQADAYGENGLQEFWRWSLQTKATVLRIPVKLDATALEMRGLLENVKAQRFSIVVANLCCQLAFVAELTSVALDLGLFAEGYFWLFTDGVTSFMDTGDLQQVMPAVGPRPGLFGVVVDIDAEPSFEKKLSERFPREMAQAPDEVSVFTATAYDATWTLARALRDLDMEALHTLSQPQQCLESQAGRRLAAGEAPPERQAASRRVLEVMRRQSFQGESGPVAFHEDGRRLNQRFKVLNILSNGSVARFGSVDADTGKLSPEPDFAPVFLGATRLVPSDAPVKQLKSPGFIPVLLLMLLPVSLLMACGCEMLWRVAAARAEAEPEEGEAAEDVEQAPATTDRPAGSQPPRALACFLACILDRVLPRLLRLIGDPEPCHGCPPPTLKRPILSDFIAGLVKAMVELVSCLTFSALMAPEELQPFLKVFLNYAIFGFIVSQLYYNFASRYMTPVRTCNISAAIFFAQVLAGCRTTLKGVPNQLEITVNTLLMATTLTTWLSGAMLWIVGTFKLTSFVRYLSEPVKLGMQVSLGYFLFATSFSISTGVSWLDFTELSQFGLYFQLSLLPKWTLTALCAAVVFWVLSRSGWPYTIPTFVGLGIGVFHIALYFTGFSIEEAKEAGWLYPPPAVAEGGDNPLSFIGRIYGMGDISWTVLLSNSPAILSAALVSPFLSAIINLILFETTFPAEEFGKSTLSYELRMDGMVQWLLAALGGYSTSPSCGGTAVHRRVGARSNWGLFSSCGLHAAFLLLPGSTDVLRFVPKYVVGAVSMLVSISLLDTGLRGSYRKLSRREYCVVWLTLLMSAAFGIQTGIASGWILSFLLFIGIVAAKAPVRLDVDAGLVSSHVIWGARSASVVAQLRGAVRMLSFQGVLFFSAAQPTLKEAERKYLRDKGHSHFLILDFSSVTGMDDSTPFEFKAFAEAAKSAGVSLVISGCDRKLLSKLRRIGVIPEGKEALDLSEREDLLPAAQHVAEAPEQWRIYTVEGADRAMEFCEGVLALRTLDLCKEVVPKPQRELQTLAALLEGELSSYVTQLSTGQRFEPGEGGIAILLSGAIEAVAELRQSAKEEDPRPEVIVVYRALPGLEHDYCFVGSTPGVLLALMDSQVVLLPQGLLSQLRQSERWADVEVVWSQLAEFMAASMHSLAMKATMQDVCGAYNSGAADTYAKAVLEHQQAEGWEESGGSPKRGERDFFRRLLIGGGAQLRGLRQSIPQGGQVFGVPPLSMASIKRQLGSREECRVVGKPMAEEAGLLGCSSGTGSEAEAPESAELPSAV